MNVLAATGLIGAAGILLYFQIPPATPDVYELSGEQAYRLLSAPAQGIAPGKPGYAVRTDARDKVTWITSGSGTYRECRLSLSPFEGNPQRTQVAVDCSGISAGAGDSAEADRRHRDEAIERVDAILTGRPFDAARAAQTAAHWPANGSGTQVAGRQVTPAGTGEAELEAMYSTADHDDFFPQ